MHKQSFHPLRTLITGFLMGSADLVPGVSGGTIAFISGIYETLISSIKIVTTQIPLLILKGKISEAIKLIPFKFLIPLAIGMGTAILSLSSAIEYLLIEHETLTLSFFFGLILASIYIVSKHVKTWTSTNIVTMIITILLGYVIATLSPTQTPANPIAFFFSGAIAICAMILPGISGSFILLIIGKYSQILSAVNDRDILTLGIFMAGAAIGIAFFSKLLSWLFKNYHDITMAALTGIMVGSLAKIWPWKNTIEYRTNSHGQLEPLYQVNTAPTDLLLPAILLMIAGAALIMIMDRYQPKEA